MVVNMIIKTKNHLQFLLIEDQDITKVVNQKMIIHILREKCLNTLELYLVRISLYSVQIQENTDHK